MSLGSVVIPWSLFYLLEEFHPRSNENMYAQVSEYLNVKLRFGGTGYDMLSQCLELSPEYSH